MNIPGVRGTTLLHVFVGLDVVNALVTLNSLYYHPNYHIWKNGRITLFNGRITMMNGWFSILKFFSLKNTG